MSHSNSLEVRRKIPKEFTCKFFILVKSVEDVRKDDNIYVVGEFGQDPTTKGYILTVASTPETFDRIEKQIINREINNVIRIESSRPLCSQNTVKTIFL